MSAADIESLPLTAWPVAARLVAQWLDRRERIDVLLDTLPRTLPSAERARLQHLVLGVVRHFGRIDAALNRLIAHPPRFSTRAVLFIAGYELIEAAAGVLEATDGMDIAGQARTLLLSLLAYRDASGGRVVYFATELEQVGWARPKIGSRGERGFFLWVLRNRTRQPHIDLGWVPVFRVRENRLR